MDGCWIDVGVWKFLQSQYARWAELNTLQPSHSVVVYRTDGMVWGWYRTRSAPYHRISLLTKALPVGRPHFALTLSPTSAPLPTPPLKIL